MSRKDSNKLNVGVKRVGEYVRHLYTYDAVLGVEYKFVLIQFNSLHS